MILAESTPFGWPDAAIVIVFIIAVTFVLWSLIKALNQ